LQLIKKYKIDTLDRLLKLIKDKLSTASDQVLQLCYSILVCTLTVAFKIYDIDRDGYISNGELFQVLKMMVGNNLKDGQLQQIVDKTIIYSDKDGDGRISYEEFCAVSITYHRCY